MVTFTGIVFIVKGFYYLEPMGKDNLYRGGTLTDVLLGISLICLAYGL